jgi:hypothetical protein
MVGSGLDSASTYVAGSMLVVASGGVTRSDTISSGGSATVSNGGTFSAGTNPHWRCSERPSGRLASGVRISGGNKPDPVAAPRPWFRRYADDLERRATGDIVSSGGR